MPPIVFHHRLSCCFSYNEGCHHRGCLDNIKNQKIFTKIQNFHESRQEQKLKTVKNTKQVTIIVPEN